MENLAICFRCSFSFPQAIHHGDEKSATKEDSIPISKSDVRFIAAPTGDYQSKAFSIGYLSRAARVCPGDVSSLRNASIKIRNQKEIFDYFKFNRDEATLWVANGAALTDGDVIRNVLSETCRSAINNL